MSVFKLPLTLCDELMKQVRAFFGGVLKMAPENAVDALGEAGNAEGFWWNCIHGFEINESSDACQTGLETHCMCNSTRVLRARYFPDRKLLDRAHLSLPDYYYITNIP